LCHAGTPLPDTDTDGVCDSIDNCPDTFNPAQSDSNANGSGDVCDGGVSLPASLTLNRVSLTSNRRQAGQDSGRIRLSAVLDVSEYEQSLADLLRDGASVGVSGAGVGPLEPMEFPGPRCVQLSASRFKCVGTKAETLKFRRKGKSGTLYNVSLFATERLFEPALAAVPLEVVLSLGGQDRQDQINCTFYDAKVFAKCRK
jgi:hypothetical protein